MTCFSSELDGARTRVDGEPPRRGDEPGALWVGEEQTAYVRLLFVSCLKGARVLTLATLGRAYCAPSTRCRAS